MAKEVSAVELDAFLNTCISVKNDLGTVIMGLRRKQITGAVQCTKATIEIVRALLVHGKFNTTEDAMRMVKAVGKRLIAAGKTELTIGNIVRRILYFIREEYARVLSEAENPPVLPEPPVRSRSSSKDVNTSMKAALSGNAAIMGSPARPRKDRSGSNLSTGSGGDSVPAPMPKFKPPPLPTMARNTSSSGNLVDQTPTLESMLSQLNLGTEVGEDFTLPFSKVKAEVLVSIKDDLGKEADNTAALTHRAKEYISADEVILTYGYSKTVEQFLTAAAAKIKFYVIVVLAAPGCEGSKLAAALAALPNKHISVTLIPDSNIYAIMSRVNKVIFAPQAVLADGGSICSAGHFMVCATAKEFAVPVMGVSGAFTFTPLFSHNMRDVLSIELSPAQVLADTVEVDLTNVEVRNPAFDFVPSELIAVYVTNEGGSLPSYVYRQLSEYYHTKDYVL